MTSLPDDRLYTKGSHNKFIAPQNTPPGSLNDDLLRLLTADGNLDPKKGEPDFGYIGEFQAFHLNSKNAQKPMPYKKIYEEACKQGFEISDKFLEIVIAKIKSLESQMPEHEFLKFLIDSFATVQIKELSGDLRDNKEIIPSQVHIVKFKKILYSLRDNYKPLLDSFSDYVNKRNKLL